ncbi:MAG TPA: Fe-S protein assembly co-chaperone HscB [Terriglobales bacterium]|jgi:molecular chaperone HscB|nr:Fe-S protein assembly co-chaperone HscB [Terriglobales bacterium]
MADEPKSTSSLIMPGEVTAACWSCGDMRAAHFCSACGKVQPPVPVDYFTFFGMPRKLNLDTSALQREFYELSRRLHPDLYAQADDQEQHWSLEKSSQLNDAYRTLRDPIKRTEYLLRLEGVELEEQSKSATEQARATGQVKKQVVPPDMLEEVFELNMKLEELRMQKKLGEDDPALIEELGRQKLELQEKFEALFHELQGYWNDWDRAVDSGTEEERAAIRNKIVDLLNRRNYIRNLVRDVNDVLES